MMGQTQHFFDNLDDLWHQGEGDNNIEDGLQDFFDVNDEYEVEDTDEDIHGVEPYLPN
jgi:hypothetical protein